MINFLFVVTKHTNLYIFTHGLKCMSNRSESASYMYCTHSRCTWVANLV